ncbi:MAG: SsrA-binding protein, partial [Thermoplasmata archaeon]|nr:SsrA-binding protein [Thermoplasmata archaeon]
MPENKVSIKKIVTNRKARYNYLIVKKLETGIELRGTEVKSLRAGKGNLSDSYARVENGEVFLHNLHISPYEHGSFDNHKPLRR